MEEQLRQLSFVQTVLIGFSLAVFYYFFIYSSTSFENILKRNNEDLDKINEKIQKINMLIREKQELEAELLKNEESVKSIKEVVTEEFNQSEALDNLITKARGYGLFIESIGEFGSWDSTVHFEKAKLNLNLKGSFEQVMFFLSDLTREKGFYTFNDIKLTPSGRSQSALRQDLTIDLKLVILKIVSEARKKALKESLGAS